MSDHHFHERMASLLGPRMIFGMERECAAARTRLWIRCQACHSVLSTMIDDGIDHAAAFGVVWQSLKDAEEHQCGVRP